MKKLFENWQKHINEAWEPKPYNKGTRDKEDVYIKRGSHRAAPEKSKYFEENEELEAPLGEVGEPEQFSDVPDLSPEESDKYVEAWRQVTKAVESGTLPESVEDAFYEMLAKLGIYL